jgi:hypothetical protein
VVYCVKTGITFLFRSASPNSCTSGPDSWSNTIAPLSLIYYGISMCDRVRASSEVLESSFLALLTISNAIVEKVVSSVEIVI